MCAMRPHCVYACLDCARMRVCDRRFFPHYFHALPAPFVSHVHLYALAGWSILSLHCVYALQLPQDDCFSLHVICASRSFVLLFILPVPFPSRVRCTSWWEGKDLGHACFFAWSSTDETFYARVMFLFIHNGRWVSFLLFIWRILYDMPLCALFYLLSFVRFAYGNNCFYGNLCLFLRGMIWWLSLWHVPSC